MAEHPFLIEIRPDQDVKNYAREIIYDIQSKFKVHAAAKGHVVPHITLFGPFSTDGYGPALSATRSACEQFSAIPYRLDGFCHFGRDVIYIDLATSHGLRELRREIRDELLPNSTPRFPRREARNCYQWHLTVAFKDINGKFDRIWKYVNEQYQPEIETYANRITFLNNRRMIKEWDIPTGKFLDPDQAVSRRSWIQTMEALKRERSESDHLDLGKPHRSCLRRLNRWRHRVFG